MSPGTSSAMRSTATGGSSIGSGLHDPSAAVASSIVVTTSSVTRLLDRALGDRSIVLVGLMGAGKSTVGRRLASRLGLMFRDADIEIETAAKLTIPDIFAIYGEPSFRDG